MEIYSGSGYSSKIHSVYDTEENQIVQSFRLQGQGRTQGQEELRQTRRQVTTRKGQQPAEPQSEVA